MAQIKNRKQIPEKELSNEEKASLSDAEFKTLVIRMLSEMTGHKMKEEMKAKQNERKQNVWGTNSKGKETGAQTNDVEQNQEINIQPEQNEETRIKNEERLRKLWDNFKHSSLRITGVPEGEEQEQEVENLFEQIMKENFPNLSKEVDFQEDFQ